MKCPHLIKWLTFTCKAKETIYFPSSFQLQEYCKTISYKKCPFIKTPGPGMNENIEDYITASRF